MLELITEAEPGTRRRKRHATVQGLDLLLPVSMQHSEKSSNSYNSGCKLIDTDEYNVFTLI
jgi:hypothetical protein